MKYRTLDRNRDQPLLPGRHDVRGHGDPGPNDVAYTPPAISSVILRRRPVAERAAAPNDGRVTARHGVRRPSHTDPVRNPGVRISAGWDSALAVLARPRRRHHFRAG